MKALKYSTRRIELRGKRFLITQSSLRLLAGSEINTLELADYLQGAGAAVTVYTYFFSDPIASLFKERGIHVTIDDRELRLEDFDYIWIHHQVFPVSLVGQIRGRVGKIKMPRMVFLHMSGLGSHYLEQAHVWDFEKNFSSLSLFVSEEAKNTVSELSLDTSSVQVGLYRNPVPITFSKYSSRKRDKLGSVLIVSNHPAPEMIQAKQYLEKKGYVVKNMGEGQKEYSLVSPEILDDFDVVVTIGKTVQYCLVANIPVFVYDVWGGPGYLNERNIDLAAYNNFSGRGFDKKEPDDIAEQIVEGFQDAVLYQDKNHGRFMETLSIDKVLPKAIVSAGKAKTPMLDNRYIYFLESILTMLRYKFYHENLMNSQEEELKKTKDQLGQSEDTVLHLKESLEDEKDRNNALVSSMSWKLTLPLRHINYLVQRIKKSFSSKR